MTIKPPARNASIQLVRTGMLLTLVGFFLPWARLELREPSFFKKISSGMRHSLHSAVGRGAGSGHRSSGWSPFSLPDIPTEVSGAQIPMLAHKEQTKVSMQLIELFTGKSEGVRWKSFAVLLVPGLALGFGWLLAAGRGGRFVAVPIGIVCIVIAGGGFWKVLTLNSRTMFSIGIRSGLWLTLWGYAVLAFAALASVRPPKSHPPAPTDQPTE